MFVNVHDNNKEFDEVQDKVIELKEQLVAQEQENALINKNV